MEIIRCKIVLSLLGVFIYWYDGIFVFKQASAIWAQNCLLVFIFNLQKFNSLVL